MGRTELRRRSGPSLWAVYDDADEDVVNQHHWTAAVRRSTTYAQANVRKLDGQRTIVLMHNLVTGWGFVDHKDHNGLNNCRSNLRESNCQLNGAGQIKQPGRSSQYKGVCWHCQRGKWLASITVNNKTVYIGLFTNEEEAAHARDAVALATFGEHALLNFPVIGQVTSCG